MHMIVTDPYSALLLYEDELANREEEPSGPQPVAQYRLYRSVRLPR